MGVWDECLPLCLVHRPNETMRTPTCIETLCKHNLGAVGPVVSIFKPPGWLQVDGGVLTDKPNRRAWPTLKSLLLGTLVVDRGLAIRS